MFYGVDLGGATEPSCGGELINVSDPNAGYFDACSSSTSFVDGQYKCEYAFSKKMIDAPFSMWASNGEGVSAWIEIRFK